MDTLTDRYVWAVVRSVPDARRSDADRQLRASIDTAVAEKVAAGFEPAAAERETLSEFGDPARRAADYVGRVSYLIGPAHFFDYRRLLTILLAAVTPSVFGGLMLAQLIAGADLLRATGIALSVAFTVAVQVAFWTTVAFALIERTEKGRPARPATWNPESLAPVPAQRIGIGETIAALLSYLLFIGLILWQQNIWVVRSAGDQPTALLDPRLWSFWLPWFIGVATLELLFAIVSFGIGRWTMTLAWVNVLLNLLFAVPACWLLGTNRVIDPSFLELFSLPAEIVTTVSTVIQLAIVVVAVLDVVHGFVRARRGR